MAERKLKSPIKVEDVKNHDLYGVVLKAIGEKEVLPDPAIQQKLFVAEDLVERSLQIRLNPTRVFSDVYGRQKGVIPGTDNVLTLPTGADAYDPLADLSEPAYDYNVDFWGEEKWGSMELNYRPVRDIARIVFAFPGNQPVWAVPDTWVRLDQKYGRIQLVPTHAQAIFATFNAFLLGVIAGGRGLPQSIFVDYTVGYSPAELEANGQDLLELIRLLALLELLGIAAAAVLPGGATNASLSLDGLSHSRGLGGGKYGAYSGKVELALERITDIRETYRNREKGVPMVFA